MRLQLNIMAAGLLIGFACPEVPAAEPPPGFGSESEASAWHTFLAELAGRSGNMRASAREFRRAAALSDDLELAQRAAEATWVWGDTADIQQAASRWLALDPDAERPRAMLASAALRRHDTTAAVMHLEALLGPPGDARAVRFGAIGRQLAQESDPEAAVVVMQALVAGHADVAHAQLGLARVALAAGLNELAEESAARAVKLAPDLSQAGMLHAQTLVALGRIDEGLELARTLAEKEPAQRFFQAGMLADLERFDEARAVFDALLADDPERHDARLAAGLMEQRAGNTDTATEHFTALLSQPVYAAEARFRLAGMAQARGDNDRALELYARLDRGPYAHDAMLRRALLMFENGDKASAWSLLDVYQENNPHYRADILRTRATLLSRDGRHGEALSWLNDAIDTQPDDESLRYLNAFLLERTGRVDDAIRELRGVLRRSPDDPSALNSLGYALADHNRELDTARGYIQRSLASDPDNAAVLDSAGWVEYRLGNLDEARRYLERAWSLAENAEMAAHLGEVLWVSGDKQAARAIWEAAAARFPDDPKLDATMTRWLR